MSRDDYGYTLMELIVVMLIFSVVMGLIAVSFNRIVASSGQVIKSVETDIGGLIGLELLRSDLELAGFGLPYSVPSLPDYRETERGAMVQGFPGTSPSLYNDIPPLPPRAVVVGDNVGYNGSDYLVLKGTPLAMNRTCRCWSYLNYNPGGTGTKEAKSEVELTPDKNERVTVLRNSIGATGGLRRELVTETGDDHVPYFTLVFNTPLSKFLPRDEDEVHLVYGVAPEKEGAADQRLLFPYNRADYYIGNPSGGTSASCAKHTGILYKVVMSQNVSNAVTYYPLLDCVADMQVFFYVDSNGDGGADSHVPDVAEAADTADEIRDRLKEIRIYLLAQQGKKDAAYWYPLGELPLVVGDAAIDKAVGRIVDSVWTESTFAALDPDWRHYHWKVYTIVVQPKNL